VEADLATMRRAMDVMDRKLRNTAQRRGSRPKAKRPYRRRVLAPDDLPRAVLEVLRIAPQPLATIDVDRLALAHLG
jgi:hypothetical protein